MKRTENKTFIQILFTNPDPSRAAVLMKQPFSQNYETIIYNAAKHTYIPETGKKSTKFKFQYIKSIRNFLLYQN